MIYAAKRIVKYLLGTDTAGRQIAVRPDDTFIVSYPRSGNTWMRFLIANLLFPNQTISFANIESLIPDAEAISSRHMKRIRGPRIIKSHQYFDHRYPKVLYLVRDPRDVLLSYYHFSRKYRHIGDDFPLETYIHRIATGTLHKTAWGTWGENVGSWLGARLGRPNFLLVRYEDLVVHTQSQLERVAYFFGVPHSPQALREAIAKSSATNLRDLEKQQHGQWVATQKTRADIPMIGSAVSGKWKSSVPEASINEIESAWGALMEQLGYELSVRRAESVMLQLAARTGAEEQQR